MAASKGSTNQAGWLRMLLTPLPLRPRRTCTATMGNTARLTAGQRGGKMDTASHPREGGAAEKGADTGQAPTTARLALLGAEYRVDVQHRSRAWWEAALARVVASSWMGRCQCPHAVALEPSGSANASRSEWRGVYERRSHVA
mmetsp:Transcript_36142/g.71850  ORF Transcript_36142/g.71850 Transcript_36142/m.71850 type:complete len:143 (-) Transcript_36142:309-737(-)